MLTDLSKQRKKAGIASGANSLSDSCLEVGEHTGSNCLRVHLPLSIRKYLHLVRTSIVRIVRERDPCLHQMPVVPAVFKILLQSLPNLGISDITESFPSLLLFA